jgi:hypothetical protein
MAKTVADQFAEVLGTAGVKRIYGIVGDSLNGLTDALRRQGKIEWVHVRHEEVAAFAAGAEAHLTGELAACAGSCGPGNLHLPARAEIPKITDQRQESAPRKCRGFSHTGKYHPGDPTAWLGDLDSNQD